MSYEARNGNCAAGPRSGRSLGGPDFDAAGERKARAGGGRVPHAGSGGVGGPPQRRQRGNRHGERLISVGRRSALNSPARDASRVAEQTPGHH